MQTVSPKMRRLKARRLGTIWFAYLHVDSVIENQNKVFFSTDSSVFKVARSASLMYFCP